MTNSYFFEDKTSHGVSDEYDGHLLVSLDFHMLCEVGRPTFPISRPSMAPSSPYFILKSKSLAKSEMFDMLLGPVEEKCALYPKVEIRAVAMSGSSGSHSLGQNKLGSPSLVHVRKLAPPRPCRNNISAVGGNSGEYNTVSPRGPFRRSTEDCLRNVRAAVDVRDSEPNFASSLLLNSDGSVSTLGEVDEGNDSLRKDTRESETTSSTSEP
jgi:hypothetical protein